jgi:DnaJ family protein A protein 2
LEDLYKGKVSKLALQKSVLCAACGGRGGKEGAVRKCPGCEGLGMKTMMRHMGPMIQRFQTVCSDCNGEGEIIKDKDRCKVCHGKKTVTERKVLHVHVDKGMQDGQKVTFKGEGDQGPDITPGDVIFVIEQKPHPRFQRKGNDLYYHAEIDLLTALAGGAIAVEHLDDRWLRVAVTPGEVISPGKFFLIVPLSIYYPQYLLFYTGSLKVVRGQGMPSHRHHDYGDLYIQFDVKFPPEYFNEPEQLALLETILPPRNLPEIPADAMMVDDVLLEEVDQSHQSRVNASAMEDDDDHHHQGTERVQCASQ